MRIGVQFQTHGVDPSDFATATAEALAVGVDGVFLWDHMVPFVGSPDDSAWETWTLLGTMAGVVRGSGADLGVLVSPLTFRHPQIVARAAATLARTISSRFILGVGAGGFVLDDRLFGDQRGTAQRMSDFGLRLRELRRAVDEQNRRHGTDVRLWVGGDGRRITIPLAAELADGWSGFGPLERWRERAAHVMGLVSERPMETSVLLTPMDLEVDFSGGREAGADWVIRSLRPDGRGGFDLEPIRRLVAGAR